jgi:hypothetical protein
MMISNLLDTLEYDTLLNHLIDLLPSATDARKNRIVEFLADIPCSRAIVTSIKWGGSDRDVADEVLTRIGEQLVDGSDAARYVALFLRQLRSNIGDKTDKERIERWELRCLLYEQLADLDGTDVFVAGRSFVDDDVHQKLVNFGDSIRVQRLLRYICISTRSDNPLLCHFIGAILSALDLVSDDKRIRVEEAAHRLGHLHALGEEAWRSRPVETSELKDRVVAIIIEAIPSNDPNALGNPHSLQHTVKLLKWVGGKVGFEPPFDEEARNVLVAPSVDPAGLEQVREWLQRSLYDVLEKLPEGPPDKPVNTRFEFYLPLYLMTVPVHHWDIVVSRRMGKCASLSLQHHAVVRSLDRYKEKPLIDEMMKRLSISSPRVRWYDLPSEVDSFRDLAEGASFGCVGFKHEFTSADLDTLTGSILAGIPFGFWVYSRGTAARHKVYSHVEPLGTAYEEKHGPELMAAVHNERRRQASPIGARLALMYEDPKLFPRSLTDRSPSKITK